eukprot:2862309-Amphidinium_carterae.1
MLESFCAEHVHFGEKKQQELDNSKVRPTRLRTEQQVLLGNEASNESIHCEGCSSWNAIVNLALNLCSLSNWLASTFAGHLSFESGLQNGDGTHPSVDDV